MDGWRMLLEGPMSPDKEGTTWRRGGVPGGRVVANGRQNQNRGRGRGWAADRG